MAKKRKPIEKGQTSLLFPFSSEKKKDEKKPKTEAKTPIKKKLEHKPIEKREKKPVEKKPDIKKALEKEIKPVEKKKIIPIPKNLFFKGNKEPFGLKVGDVDMSAAKKKSVSSKYIHYLEKRGEFVTDMEKGLLLDLNYDGFQNKAYCKFYDLDAAEIRIWLDTTDHKPYCYSKQTISQLESNIALTNNAEFEYMEEVSRTDLLTDKEVKLVKIYGKTPLAIGGGRKTNFKSILEGEVWEADIRYHHNYIYDRGLIPGLVYKIKDGKIEKIDYNENKKESEQVAEELRGIFKEESIEMQDFAERNLDIFLTPIPNVNRMALDIEVSVGKEDYQVPDPRMAKREIISISFVATDGLKLVYVLERPGFSYDGFHEKFPKDGKVIFFKSEKELLTESFRLMWEYPIIITFNGDNFDLNYMFHRANRLKIDRMLNPIQVGRGFGMMSSAECELSRGIHVDLFNFFFNRSISGYAFGGAYERNSLNAISSALLKEGKYEHEEEIHAMTYSVLTWYNLKDSLLTLDLTQFNNSLVWNLMILLCRMTKLPIHDMLRHQISAWIKNIFLYEHRQKGYLIPRRREIKDMKKGGYSKSTIEGKGFQGAYVIDPIPGIHYNVVVMDFASLYPSIIKEYNLSYETVQCPHNDCSENFIKGIPYHVCTHKMGIFAYVVGFFRDVRVKFFKPKSGNKNLSADRRSYYNTIQQALKVFINGSYGVFGSKNFPLFCLPVAESTTGIGRYSIISTIEKSESMGVKVLYGDSDSVFLQSPTKAQLKELSDWSKEELDLDLEEEKTYQFLALSKRKKNYVGIYKDSKNVDTKGLVAKKRNTPNFIKQVFSQLTDILKNITNDGEFQKARKLIVEIISQNLKKIGKSNTYSLNDYAINIALKKNIHSYEKTTPQHVRAALEILNIELEAARNKNATKRELSAIEKKYNAGRIITFIKSRSSSGAKVIALAKLHDVDVKKYKQLLKSALAQVLDALDISIEEISGIKKMDSFF